MTAAATPSSDLASGMDAATAPPPMSAMSIERLLALIRPLYVLLARLRLQADQGRSTTS